MRIQFNQTFLGKNYNSVSKWQYFTQKTSASQPTPIISNENKNNISPLYFANISFQKRNIDADFLLKQAKHLKCAYSGKLMLTQGEIKDIYQKLERRISAQDVVNLLQPYEKYMHDTEIEIFKLIKAAKHKNKRNLQDILKEYQPDALIRLKEKQKNILLSTDSLIEKLSPNLAELVRLIRDNALLKIKDNSFGREPPLEMIKAIKAKGADKNIIIKIYQAWYKLPNSARDVDAFIVKYSKNTHQEIARRLICSSMATIEHIVPTSRKKKNANFMNNMILVSKRFNNERKSMPLDEYIMLNQEVDIRKHLQKYIDLVIREINRPNSDLSTCYGYPDKIRRAITKETSGKVNLVTDSLVLTKAQKKALKAPLRLAQKYRIVEDYS